MKYFGELAKNSEEGQLSLLSSETTTHFPTAGSLLYYLAALLWLSFCSLNTSLMFKRASGACSSHWATYGGRIETLPLKNEFPDALEVFSWKSSSKNLLLITNKSQKSQLLLHRLVFCIAYAIRRVRLKNKTKILGNNQKRNYNIRQKSTRLTAETFKAILEKLKRTSICTLEQTKIPP